MHSSNRFFTVSQALAVVLFLAACGGGGSSPSNTGSANSAGNAASDASGTTGNSTDNNAGQSSGTPADDDNDNVPNESDQCPGTASGDSVDPGTGCSTSQLDDDSDGVANGSDQCSNTPANTAVDGNGCSTAQLNDTDADGVENDSDLCPNTPAGATVDGDGCPPAGTRQGVTYDVNLASAVDGENIAFTVHEPEALVAGQGYPLILHSHGYGGSRQATRPDGGLMRRFLDNGYGVLSLDERGHNDSGGTIRILDPEKEGLDWLQVLDWTEVNLDWMAFESGNPIMGAIGGSYGGGYQHLIYAIDTKHRLDAIAPDITWHDLRYSLYAGDVFKTFWAGLLSAGGNRPGNRQDTEVNEGLLDGTAGNNLGQDKLDLLYKHSLISHCENANTTTAPGGLTPIDAFITQSPLDTLFNFNDAYHNYQCLLNLGGDVRFFAKSAGHGIDNGDGGQNCGSIDRDDATFHWYQEKLKGAEFPNADDFIPEICLNLGTEGSDAISVPSITVGGSVTTNIPQQTMALGEGNPQIVTLPLHQVGSGGDIIAGIPIIEITIQDPVLGNNGAGDPIVFVGIGVQANGGSAPTAPIMNQVRPIRGYGTKTIELNGVLERIPEGDSVVLMLFASHPQQYPTSGSTPAATVQIDADVSIPMLGGNFTQL